MNRGFQEKFSSRQAVEGAEAIKGCKPLLNHSEVEDFILIFQISSQTKLAKDAAMNP